MPQKVSDFQIGKIKFKKIVRYPSSKGEFVYEGKIRKGYKRVGWFHGDAKNISSFKKNVKNLDFYINEKRAKQSISKSDLKKR